MEKTSKVKQAKYLNKTWENHYGTFHVHGIAFENGDFGEYSSVHPEQDKFVVGQLATYNMTGEPGKQKIKPVNPKMYGDRHGEGFSKPKETKNDRNKSFALAYAKDIVIAQIRCGNEWDEMELLQLAETFNAWLNGESKKETLDPAPKEEHHTPSDDLPF
jgi:hypothetical protein